MTIEYLKGKENAIAEALSRVSPLPVTKQEGQKKDTIPVYMLTTELPADSSSVVEFEKATAKDTTSSLLMQAVMNGCPESRKDCHPLLLDY